MIKDYFTLLGTILLNITLVQISTVLSICVAIVTLVWFIGFKIPNARVDNKIKKKTLENMNKQ